MKISELQAQLEEIKKEHGDLPLSLIDSNGIFFNLVVDSALLYTQERFAVIGREFKQSKQLRPFLYEHQ